MIYAQNFKYTTIMKILRLVTKFQFLILWQFLDLKTLILDTKTRILGLKSHISSLNLV